MIAPCSPAPEIAGKLSLAEPVHLPPQRQQLRRGRHLRHARRPAPPSRSQCRKRHTATASRAWAVAGARLLRRRSCRPSAAGRGPARPPPWRRPPAASARTRPASRPDRRAPACRPAARGPAPAPRAPPPTRHCPARRRVASGSLAGSMNNSVAPSACTRAKPRAKGVNGTSPPRMFSSQAIEAGSVSTAASCFASAQGLGDVRALLLGRAPGIVQRMRHGRGERAAAADRSRPRRPGCG